MTSAYYVVKKFLFIFKNKNEIENFIIFELTLLKCFDAY